MFLYYLSCGKGAKDAVIGRNILSYLFLLLFPLLIPYITLILV